MKLKLLLMLCALFLLCGCSEPVGIPDNCLNTPLYMQIGDTIYQDYAASLRAFNTAFPEGYSLCYDPLCSHSREEFCPEMLNVDHVVTDGERIYTQADDRDGSAIYSMKPDGSDLKLLVTFPRVDGLVTGFSTDGIDLYYVEGYYKGEQGGDTYGIPMKLSCSGGKPEQILEGEFTAYAEIYADAEHYYITDNGLFSVINRKDGRRIDVQLPTPETYGVILHDGNVYLYGIAENHDYQINSRFLFGRKELWKWNGSEFEKVISDIDQLVWDESGVWYTPMLPVEEFELIGSKESYNGKDMSLYDFIRTWTGELVYHDLATDEKTVYKTDSVNLKIEPQGAANGYIIAAVNDYSELSHIFEYVNLKPEADGTVTVHEAFKSQTEETE